MHTIILGGGPSDDGYGSQPTPSTGSTTTVASTTTTTTVAKDASTLPVTGSDLMGVGVIGGGLLLLGTLTTIARRRT